MKLVYSSRFLHHPGFPESPERLLAVRKFLAEKGIGKEFYVLPEKIREKDLLLVHAKQLLQELKERSASMLSTPDNPFQENTYETAKLSAGAALKAARIAGEEFAFSLGRPPGHHAGTNSFGGFCYLNNVAFAVRKVQREGLAEKVLIVDFDVHLGQGTQEIFSGDDSVFYLSLHQDTATIYPWRDFPARDKTTRLVPLQAGTGDRGYVEVFGAEAEEAVRKFEPHLLAVSAGFDIFHADLSVGAALGVESSETFRAVGERLASFGIPCFAVLEGGYDLKTLGENVFSFLRAFY